MGAESFTGAASVLAVIQQGSPIVTALLIAGAAGSAVTADLGSRTIRERSMPWKCSASIRCSGSSSPGCSRWCGRGAPQRARVRRRHRRGYFFNVILQGGTPGAYLASFSALAQLPDLYIAEVKAAIFGVIAGVIAAYKGLTPKGGPKGVGEAVNQAVVITFWCCSSPT